MKSFKNNVVRIFKRVPSMPSKTTPSPLKRTMISQDQLNASDGSNRLNKPLKQTPSLRSDTRRIIIIWFEPTFFIRNEFKQILDKLNMECHQVDVFTDIDECVASLTKIAFDFKVYLLMPGMWSNDLFNHLQHSSAWKMTINEIFIYSSSPQQYECLREQNPCIQKICVSIEDVWNIIHSRIDKHCEVLRFYDQRSVRDLSSEDTIAEFVWFIVFKDALFQLPRDQKSIDDMLVVCQHFYANDIVQLDLIDKFKDTYLAKDAPKWYSRSSFLYKLINRALRTQDVEQLYVFRYFIRDLSSWLSREFYKITSCTEVFFVYRGAALSQDDFQSLDREKLLAPNGFFSTSRDIDVAKLFIGSSRSDTVRVLYKIKCDIKCYSQEEINELVAFADISENSHMPDEKEVLFDLGATFELENIESPSLENDCFVIHLIPSCKGAHILREYRQNYRNEIESSDAALKFGILLFKTGKYMVAQHYFEQLLNDPNNENISDIHHHLGWTHMRQSNYEQAIINFERAHDLIPKSNGISRATVLNSIGKALVEKDFNKESLSYYKRALDLRISCLGFEHKDVADSYANVARLYNRAGNYHLAVEYYNKSLTAYTTSAKSLNPENDTETTEETGSKKFFGGDDHSFNKSHHPSLSIRISDPLYELGSIQCQMGESDSGLHNMSRSLTIDRYSSFHRRSELFGSLHSLGNISPLPNPFSKEIDYRLRCLENAKRHPSKSGTAITNALEGVGSAYAANGKFKEALIYYESALKRREKQGKDFKSSLQIAQTLNFIGNMHRDLYQLENALDYYRRAVTIYEKFPCQANRDRLRTINKIDTVTQEMSPKSIVSTMTPISRNITVFKSAERHLRRSASLQSNSSFFRRNFSPRKSYACSISSTKAECNSKST
jgi:tetratricopeptide (TPR) repeat protein